MAFWISTVNSSVKIRDLGLIISHPTQDRDLATEFSLNELQNSEDLNAAISSGALKLKLNDVKYGTYEVQANEYKSSLVIHNAIQDHQLEAYLTEDELSAGKLNKLVSPNLENLNVTSTAALTKNVYCTTGNFQDRGVGLGDKIVITGGSAAGTYTVSEVVDQHQLHVSEPIVNSTNAGTLSIFHPVGATRVGIDTASLYSVGGSTLQSVIEDFDTRVSPKNADIEITYSNMLVSKITTWTNSSRNNKIKERLITYSGVFPSTVIEIYYKADGITENYRITNSITYSGNKVTGVSKVKA